MKEFDIFNPLKRKVVVKATGKITNVKSVQVHSSYTLVECDDEIFNSVKLAEVENCSLQKILSAVKSGNSWKVIGRFSKPCNISLVLGNRISIIIPKEDVEKIAVYDVYSIGRNIDCNMRTAYYSSEVSRMHCFVYRESEESYRIIDCSTYGTEIILD